MNCGVKSKQKQFLRSVPKAVTDCQIFSDKTMLEKLKSQSNRVELTIHTVSWVRTIAAGTLENVRREPAKCSAEMSRLLE